MTSQRTATEETRPKGEGGALSSNGLLGICPWMGSHFQSSTNYNGVAFSGLFQQSY